MHRFRFLLTTILAALAGPTVAIVLVADPAQASGPTYDLQGGWIVQESHSNGAPVTQTGGDEYTITSMDMGTGSFSGTAMISGVSFAVAGTESGSVATYTLSESGYVATDTLNLGTLSDGNVGGDGSFTDNNGSSGNFSAELTAPANGTGTTTTGTGTTTTSTTGTTTTSTTGTTTTSTTPTTTTGTTTTTSTAPSVIPTATAIECDYFVASQNDVCTATVGNTDGSITSNPTGAVNFTGDRTGSCSLQPTSGSPGIASCSVTVPGNGTIVLNVTATYVGDATHASSNANTQFLTAAPGNGVYNGTIQQFNPQTLQFTQDNPVSGSTLTLSGTLTQDGTSCTAPEMSMSVARIARKAKAVVRRLTVTQTIRHAPKGKVRLHLRFSAAKLRRLFPGTHMITLVLTSTVTPPHGPAQAVEQVETFTLAAPAHGKVKISHLRADTGSATHLAFRLRREAQPHVKGTPQAGSVYYGGTANISQGCGDLTGTLTVSVAVPPASDATRLADVTASISGNASYRLCGEMKLAAPLPVPVDANGVGAESASTVFAGKYYQGVGGTVTGADSTNLQYIVNTAGGVISGEIGTGNSSCATVDLFKTGLG